MQTTYNLYPDKALPGLLCGNPIDNYVVGNLLSNEILEPGRFVVLDAATGKLKVPATTGGALTEELVGVVIFNPMFQQTAIPAAGFTYPAGVRVAILRKGRIWVQVASSAEPTPLVSVNVKHSSTVATDRGKATTDAANGTAGTEIATPGPVKFVEKATTALWAVELNLP